MLIVLKFVIKCFFNERAFDDYLESTKYTVVI